MKEKIIRTKNEIQAVLEEADNGINEGSQYPGMSYEEGIKVMYEWLTEPGTENPFE